MHKGFKGVLPIDLKMKMQKYSTLVLNSILTQVDQLRDLVNEFSSFAKLPDANLKNGSINEFLKMRLISIVLGIA